MNLSDFDFELPEELIAQHPPAERGGSRLIVFNRARKESEHTTFDRLPSYLRRGDLLVQVVPQRRAVEDFLRAGGLDWRRAVKFQRPSRSIHY